MPDTTPPAMNATRVALDILTSIEKVATEWEAAGKHTDAALVRRRGPQFAADLSRIIADNPSVALPILNEHLTRMLASIERPTP